MTIKAYAKINWSLAITGVRADGYHLLDMLIQPISLHDTLAFAPARRDITLAMEGATLPIGDNLVCRAAQLLRRQYAVQAGAAIHLKKRIPMGAGLGGGSADAAATLLGLRALWQLAIPDDALLRLGAQLGADVPFCLHALLRGGLARVQGIGERITPLPTPPQHPLVIVQPSQGLSTPVVFRAYDDAPTAGPSIEAAQAALLLGRPCALSAALGNALQSAASRLLPEIGDCLQTLRAQGACCALMTGSGSAVFGVFATAEAAQAAQAVCKVRWPRSFCCHTL